MTWNGSPLRDSKLVRRDSWRRTISFKLRSSTASSTGSRIRQGKVKLKSVVPGIN